MEIYLEAFALTIIVDIIDNSGDEFYREGEMTKSLSDKDGSEIPLGADGTLVRIRLHRVAHGRSGDKGNRQNISVIAYDPAVWPFLLEQVTENRVQEFFRHRGVSGVRRYELPKLQVLNFVIDDALEGGVNAALALDTHGKTSAFRLLSMEIEIPRQIASLFPEPSITSRKGGTE